MQAGRAKAVDRLYASSLRVASHEHGHARVRGGGAWVEHVANHNVLNEGLVDVGLLGNSFEARLKHGLKTSILLRSALGTGHGCAGHADDDDIVIALGTDLATVVAGVLGEVFICLAESLHAKFLLQLYRIGRDNYLIFSEVAPNIFP